MSKGLENANINLVFPVPYLSAGANYKGNSQHVIIHPLIICKKNPDRRFTSS